MMLFSTFQKKIVNEIFTEGKSKQINKNLTEKDRLLNNRTSITDIFQMKTQCEINRN